MTQVLSTVKCAYCGKEKSPKEMKIGATFRLERKFDKRKQKFQNYTTKQKNWYCRDGCHPDDRVSEIRR